MLLRSSATATATATAASRVALKLIGASSRQLIFHPTRAIVSTPINPIPIRQFLVSDPTLSQFSMMDQSRGYSSSRRAAAFSSEDDENENENDDDDDDEEFDSDDVVDFEDNSEVDASDSD